MSSTVSTQETQPFTLPDIKKIDWSQSLTKPFWFLNDALSTHYLNAFSIGIVLCEHFIIKTYRSLRSDIKDPALQVRLDAFCLEEMTHAAQHTRYNQAIKQYGYPVQFLQSLLRLYFNIHFKCLSRKSKLALIIGMESLGTIASQVLMLIFKQYTKHQINVPNPLFIWHAQEELEHQHEPLSLYLYFKGGYIRRLIFFLYFFIGMFSFYLTVIYLFTISDLYQGRIVKRKGFFKRFYTILKRTKALSILFKSYREILKPGFKGFEACCE